MKAMVYTRPGEMTIAERAYPELVAGEVILRVRAVGICGSELHGYLGHDRTRRPGMIFGHELAATVEASTSPHFPPGTLVTANSALHCGVCDYCLQGRDNLCVERRSLGKHRQGAFAEFIAVPVSALIEVPQDMDPLHVAMVEPMATAMHGINSSARFLTRPLPEARALVLGGGAIGLIAALLLKYFGCRDVTLGETNALRRASAAAVTRCATYDPAATTPDEAAYDYVFDAVGSKASLAAALAAVKRGGVITEAGLADLEGTLDIQKLVRAGIALVGVANYPTTELRASVQAIHAGVLDDLTWVQVRPFEEGPRAFADLVGGALPYAKIVLRPSPDAH